MYTIIVRGKCSDMCSFDVVDADDNVVLELEGYVPSGVGIGGGDYLRLKIDIETGQIVNWDAASVKQRITEYIEEGENK